MEPQLAALAAAGAWVMGVTLGVFGAGGSILTVPLLTYLLAFPVALATHCSLLVVGVVSAFGVLWQGAKGAVRWRPTAWFALPAMGGMFLMKSVWLPRLPERVPMLGFGSIGKDHLLLATFALFMFAAAVSMLFVKVKEPSSGSAFGVRQRLALAGTGFLTGCLAGFVGAGGGFLIVPALVFLGGFPLAQATQASLAVIALNSLWGFWVGTRDWAALPHAVLGIVVGAALAGMITGLWLRARVPAERLKPAFGWFVLLMGAWILYRAGRP